MRIGFDAKRAFHNFTGLGNYSRTLIKGLDNYYPSNQYLLYSPPLKSERPLKWFNSLNRSKLVVPAKLPSKLFPALWRSFGITSLLEFDRVDLYHGLSHELPRGIEKLSLKKVVTIHDLIYLKFPNLFPFIDRNVYHQKFRHSTKIADRVVAISEQTKRDLIKEFNLPEKKIEVVYQSCSSMYYTAPRKLEMDSVKAKYSLPERYILYVGSLEERKNLLNLIEGFHEFSKSNSDVNLLFVGRGGSYREKMLARVTELKLRKRLYFIDNADSLDLPPLYKMATAFVYPSIYEGFGIPIIESLFMGTPVITTMGGCFEEAGGPHSHYVDTQSPHEIAIAFQTIVSNQKKREEMSLEGLKYVARFSDQVTTKNLIECYQKIL